MADNELTPPCPTQVVLTEMTAADIVKAATDAGQSNKGMLWVLADPDDISWEGLRNWRLVSGSPFTSAEALTAAKAKCTGEHTWTGFADSRIVVVFYQLEDGTETNEWFELPSSRLPLEQFYLSLGPNGTPKHPEAHYFIGTRTPSVLYTVDTVDNVT